MSFSSDIKKELCDVRELSPQQAEAMLYGIMYASRMDEGRPLIQTENIDLMNAAAELIRAVFPNVRTGIVRLVKNSGSLYTLKIRSGWEDIAERFGDFSSISREAVSGGDEESGAFLRGVFVSCGSVTDPNKEYHLELVLPENDRTPALLDFIAEHYAEPLTLDALAEQVNEKAGHVSYLFYKYKNIRPIDYPINYRVRIATELLRSGDYTVTQAAHEVGYRDACYFSRIYKKRMGFPPTRILP